MYSCWWKCKNVLIHQSVCFLLELSSIVSTDVISCLMVHFPCQCLISIDSSFPNHVQLNDKLPILQKSHLAQEIHPLVRFVVVVLEQVFSACIHQMLTDELYDNGTLRNQNADSQGAFGKTCNREAP